MLIYAIIGIVVAVIGFLIVELGGKRFGRDFTFYSMLAVVFFSLIAASLFPEPGGTTYQLGWMLGMLVMVGLGFARRSRNRKQ